MFTPAFPRIPALFAALFSTAVIAGGSTIISESPWTSQANAQSVSTTHGVRALGNSRNSNRLFIKRKREIARRNERVVIQNQLQSQRRSQAVLANPHRRSAPGIVVLNSGSRAYHSGIVLRGNRRDRLFVQRKRELDRRNDRVLVENALQAERRSGAVLANPRKTFDINDGLLTTAGTSVSGGAHSSVLPCPTKYNCGYRLYTDGTGPRIIAPGVPAGNGLPPYDGISGPVIITPYDN